MTLDFVLFEATQYFDQLTQFLYKIILDFFPRVHNFNRFQKFIALNFTIILTYFIIAIFDRISIKKTYAFIMKLVFKLPFVRSKVQQQLKVIKFQIQSSFPPQCRSSLKQIPYKNPGIIIQDKSDIQSLKGLMSGSRYSIKNHSDFVMSLAKNFSFSNPLHLDLFPYVKQMQNQVIQMCSRMLNFTDKKGQAIGTLNSGGTQSILMAIYSYREFKYKNEDVKNPNMIICSTGHVAALKAAQYFNIETRIVSYDKDYKMSLKQIKRKVDSNTICVYASFPNYPYGTVDPICDIASFCKKKNIPVHLDMCLGGFLVPFLKTYQNQKCEFKLPQGVTSISLDPHKYGLSAKGASVCLFSDDLYRRQQYFVTLYWPGGLYGTPGLAGSRSGLPIAASWISMMKMGEQGYTKNALLVQNATIKVANFLRENGFKVFGNPDICIVSFVHQKFSVNCIDKFMKQKGWHLSIMQKPLCLHFSFTPLNSLKADQMIVDLKQCVKQLKDKPIQKNGSFIQLYGACAKIPDSFTKDLIIGTVLDSFIDI